MIYKTFAAITLLTAPLVVLGVEGFLPRQGSVPIQPEVAPVRPQVQPAPPPYQSPMPAVTEIPAESGFGQPVEEAGKPFLSPGAGLPPPASPAPAGGFAPPPVPDELPR